MPTNKVFNLELAKERALVLSQGRDIAEPTLISIQRNAIRWSAVSRARPAANTATPTIETLRTASRVPALAAIQEVCVWECKGDKSSPRSYSGAEQRLKYRPHFLQSMRGTVLLECMQDSEATLAVCAIRAIVQRADRLFENAQDCEVERDHLIRRPVDAYLSMRKELLDRIENTRGFTQLIQKQERLLQRISTSIQSAFATELTRDPSQGFRMFHALYQAHRDSLMYGGGTEIQQTVYLLEMLMDHVQGGHMRGLLADPHSAITQMQEENVLKKLVAHARMHQMTNVHIQPDD